VNVRLHPKATEEIEATATWYESAQPGMSSAFLIEVSRAFDVIAVNPDM
jgi:hypothetical protein